MFRSLLIQNFRGFGELALDDVGGVNLIVGKNNTGKTSLLEAITLLAAPEKLTSLPGLFRANAGAVTDRFYRWLPRDGTQDGAALLSASVPGEEQRRILLQPTSRDVLWPGAWPPGVSSVVAGGLQIWMNQGLRPMSLHAVSVQHRSPDAMVDAFAEAVRAPVDEKQLESVLASVDPRIRSVRLDSVQARPFIVVDLGLSERVPLSQAGQGIYRLVAIFSELLGNKPSVCFVDEIENGIHYSAHAQVWAGIAEMAARLGVQVFATTHSWECLLAAHEVFAARPTYDLRVIQLYRIGETVTGRVLDRAHIAAAVQGDIELR